MIVFTHPLHCKIPNFINAFPVILGKPLISNGSIKAFHMHILLWFAWLDMDSLDLMLCWPLHESVAYKFGAIVTSYTAGLQHQTMIW